MSAVKCPFCELPQKREIEIAHNELAWAFPTNIPIVPGHILVVPIRCVAKFEDLTTQEVIAIFDLKKKLKKALTKIFNADGFNFAWNEGKVGGQSVPHFHLHVLPRKKGDTGITEYEPRKFLYRPERDRPENPHAELKAIAELVKKEISQIDTI